MQEWAAAGPDGGAVAGDDQLALLFACCHPALDPASRVTLTLRVVCGLPTASIARLLLLEPAMPRASEAAPAVQATVAAARPPGSGAAGLGPAGPERGREPPQVVEEAGDGVGGGEGGKPAVAAVAHAFEPGYPGPWPCPGRAGRGCRCRAAERAMTGVATSAGRAQ